MIAASEFSHNSDPVGGLADCESFARRTRRNVLRVAGEAMSSRCSSMVPVVESSAMVGIIIGFWLILLLDCNIYSSLNGTSCYYCCFMLLDLKIMNFAKIYLSTHNLVLEAIFYK